MKKLILIISILVLLFGCEKSRTIDVLPNYDIEYYKVSNFDRYSLNLVPEETQMIMQSDVYDIFKNIADKDKVVNPYIYELYIYNGRISKLKSSKEWNSQIDDLLFKKMTYWEFGNFVKDGVSQKYRISFSFGAYYYKIKDEEKVSAVVYGNQAVKIDEKLFFLAVEQMPEPIGGVKSIQKNVKYPEVAKMNGIEGRVFIKAYIDSAGVVAETEIIKGIGSGCDEAAMSAVKKVRFKPGMQRGKPVGVQVTVPILFKL